VSVLATVVTVGLAASGVTAIARALAPVTWLLVKPLSCDLCMSWWSSLAITGTLLLSEPISLAQSVAVVTGGVGVALVTTKAANRLSV
jgi:hypothetical protein